MVLPVDVVRVCANGVVATEAVIESMPEVWDEPEEADRLPEEAARYAELAANLKERNARRVEMKKKIAQYKKLKEELEPLGDAKDNVQENLCTRDGSVEAELQKMRMLLARVKGRLETMDGSEQRRSRDEVDSDGDEAKAVSVLFDS